MVVVSASQLRRSDAVVAVREDDTMKHALSAVVGVVVAVVLAGFPAAQCAWADDESDEVEIKIRAPLDDCIPSPPTIVVLGLTIDAGGHVVQEDDESDGDEQPIDLTTLVNGTFVEVTLDLMLTSDIPGAFVATTLEVKNFTNHVDVEVLGPDGEVVDDRDAAGNPVNDVRVELTETVKVHGARRGRGGRSKRVLHFHTRSNGSVVLSGLPTGHGKVRATRVVGGSAMTGEGRVVVGPNGTRHRRVVLHHAG